ncbi:serine/threonine-protein kinase [Kutzneria viridogrisea]|uniref:non-specific serine/threonine protein kinase n=3 Tax=Pseudonocardiaceae TaxID=2070 RepID=W5W6S4_9PSEU|nr:putative serine/threonine-protein kinase pknG [Kutzneria albida DSM 43870]MBA8928596.1 serine/threonine-protein kinase PknG [Kutzneria viridogrisea]
MTGAVPTGLEQTGWGTDGWRPPSQPSRPLSARAITRGRLGAGLVEVPRVPYRDPTTAVLENPVVAESKRFCCLCGGKVGRGTDGEPGATEGFCPRCGTRFSFLPKLAPGDVLGGQYEVLGCLAYGGLGWIYLARDHNVNDRWVVLKGLIDTGDTAAMAAAVAERRFLAEVEHPNIVKIYNFVQYPEPTTGTMVGYIVMEYVGGNSLRELALARRRPDGLIDPMPLTQVIAYGLEVLPALGYLHGLGLLYCDLKPDNVIQTDEQLKLLDLGAVRRMDDYESPMFYTAGYGAPELGRRGPSVASDLYTVGRMLAVLSFEFPEYRGVHKHSLPGVEQVPLFEVFESYHRFLLRATHADPGRRFGSAGEMADQLVGVLREVCAIGGDQPPPGLSTVFSPQRRTFGSQAELVPPDPAEVAVALPVPQVDTDDPAAGYLATMTGTDPATVISGLDSAPMITAEVQLRRARALIDLHDLSEAAVVLAEVAEDSPGDWRAEWYRGLVAVADGQPAQARAAFDSVYDSLPGEPAARLALAVSAELCGDQQAAARYYELVWRTDNTYVSAAFGLARTRLAQGHRSWAVEILDSVPDSSSQHVAAQVAAIHVRISNRAGRELAVTDLVEAGERLQRLSLDATARAQLVADVLSAAFAWVQAGGDGVAIRVLDCPLTERDLRFGLEACYRALARMAGTISERVALVDRANAVRPRTLT